jgi:hypothetical protein
MAGPVPKFSPAFIAVMLAGLAGLAVTSIADTPADHLALIEANFSPGQADQTIAAINTGLQSWSSAQLPRAFMIRGQAKLALAGLATQADEKKKLYVQAGLDFMRVAALFPYSSQAPDALLLAGQSCDSAGDPSGAAAIYRTLVGKYPDSQAAGRAKETQK